MARRHRHHPGATRRLDGYLCDIAVPRLLSLCRTQAVTGTLHIDSWGLVARIEWHRGEILEAFFGRARGEQALRELEDLREGFFVLRSDAPVETRVTERHAPTPPPIPVQTAPARPATAQPPPPPRGWSAPPVPAWPAPWPGGQVLAPQGYAAYQLTPSVKRRWPGVGLGILCLAVLLCMAAI